MRAGFEWEKKIIVGLRIIMGAMQVETITGQSFREEGSQP